MTSGGYTMEEAWRLQPASRTPPAVKLSAREEDALRTLATVYYGGEAHCLYFRSIASPRLPLDAVRRTVRALARKGMAKFERGLMNEDGAVAGAGYCCTDAGKAWIDARDAAA